MSAVTPQRILIVGPSWVGDMVMAQPLFAALRRQYPDCVIDVLAPDWSRPLLERMAEVRTALALPFGHGELRLRERRAYGRALRGHYDRAVLLPNSLKSALIPWWARIPVRTGWRGEMRYGLLNDLRVLDEARYPLMVQRFVALAGAPNAPVPERAELEAPTLHTDAEAAEQARARLKLHRDRPVLGLCPGAEFGPSKRWPERHFAATAHAWLHNGGQVWIFGSPGDRAVAEAIRAELPAGEQKRVQILAGHTSLAEAVDLLARTDAVVSNDSGLMHIAAAVRRPLVALYGSSSPDFTPPLSPNSEIIWLGLDCSPCFQRECPLGHHDCMEKLEPARVNAALRRLTGPL